MPSYTPEQWRLLSQQLDQALELSESEREVWLAQQRQSAPEMAAELEQLLAHHQQTGFSQFLEGSALGMADPPDQPTLVGRTVGAYIIDQEVGRGGMGSVWRARRVDGRFESEVAIKFVHAAWLGRSGEQRFRIEGTLLGQLNHPNIARLLDAGLMDGSQPYLVLEYIKGEAIDSYCRHHNLNVEARIRLFLEVLAAVAHAHSHLIVHRDIKPANIFVTDDGTVKLLDFGIAKLLDDAGSAGLTKSNAVALTPQYAAPEQLMGQPVTTATDVYSLGLVLYQLLTGRHPLADQDTSSANLIHAVLTQDPPRPSTATTVPLIKPRSLQGDLDNIVLKALKKSPAERYSSAEAFAADLRGYLNHEPVSARRDSFTYVVGKLVRKHRLQVGAASVTVLALIAGTTGTALQAREARLQKNEALAQRDFARAQLERHDAIFDFVQMMLTESVPPDQVATMQSMLDRSAQFVEVASAGKLNRQAEILSTLASYYVALDNPQKAATLLEKASKLVESDSNLSLRAQLACNYGMSLNMLGQAGEAVKIFEQWGKNPAIDGDTAGFCLQSRAVVAQNQGNADDALAFTDLAMQRVKNDAAPSERFLAELSGDRGFALHMAGRNVEADKYFASAVGQFKKMGVENSRRAQVTMANWAIVEYGCGDYKRGLEIYTQLVRTAEQLAGPAPVSPGLLGNYAHGLEAMGHYPEALRAYERTYESAEKTGFVGAQAYALVGEASVRVTQGDLTQAQSDLKHASAVMQGKVGETSIIQLRRSYTQAQIDVAQKHPESAITALNRIIELSNAKNSAGNAAAVSAYRLRAEIEMRQGQGEAAETDARKAVHMAESLQGANRFSSDTGLSYLTLGGVLMSAPNRSQAPVALQAAVDHLSNALGEEHPDTQQAKHLLAQL
jgi:serine/threonine protein kinase/tetratricopeptide (TPR) repeat protein